MKGDNDSGSSNDTTNVQNLTDNWVAKTCFNSSHFDSILSIIKCKIKRKNLANELKRFLLWSKFKYLYAKQITESNSLMMNCN